MHSEAQTSPQSGNNPSENKKLSAQCPRCKSYKTIKKGLSKTLNRGNQQRNICKECKYSFIVDKGFWKMKFSEAKVNQAIDTYFEGLSLRKVRRNFHRYSELKVSHQSILNWIHKYSYLMKQYVETLEPRLSGHFMTDETMIRCNGKWHNLGVVFDKHTRYVVATRYSEYEYISAEDNIKLWNEAKQIKRPYKFSSDSHITYEEAFKKVFYSRYKKDFVEWNKINCAKTGQFNFIMERLFNSLKERSERALKRARDDENFQVVTPAQIAEQINNVLGVIQIVLIGIAAISLVVGGIGIMNSMKARVRGVLMIEAVAMVE